MLNPDERDRLCVVLVRARNPSNIGAVARAMHDFGFSRLRVVNEFAAPFEGARSAVDASEVLARAVSCASVAEAVGDSTLVVGTTAVGERNLQHKLLRLAEAAPLLRSELRTEPGAEPRSDLAHPTPPLAPDLDGTTTNAAGKNAARVALLFGSEKTGLSNEELSHCNWLLTIPMQRHADVRHSSMNLGQAVAVCLYELARDTSVTRTVTDEPAPADAAALERLTALLTEVLEKTEYPRRHPGQSDLATVRRLVRRMGLDEQDGMVWQGILRQILWKLRAKGVNRSTSRRS
jgi:tRNA C32,U32 (ribose-2'-O)-methylase TrmJ